MIRDLATDIEKRELFGRLAAHFKVRAGEVEKAIHSANRGEAFVARRER